MENFKFQHNYDFSIEDFTNINHKNFPYYPNIKFGISFYKDIALYLNSRKLSQKSSKYPKYIIDIKDAKEKSNEKWKFWHICLRFRLTKNNELVIIKLKIKIKNLDKNISTLEKNFKDFITKKYNLYIVPFKINEYVILNNLHIEKITLM